MGTWKIVILLLLISCASCQPNGTRRPDSPICTPLSSDREQWECTDSRGDFKTPTDNVIGTTLDGYLVLEKYVDDLEIENRKLRRQCRGQ